MLSKLKKTRLYCYRRSFKNLVFGDEIRKRDACVHQSAHVFAVCTASIGSRDDRMRLFDLVFGQARDDDRELLERSHVEISWSESFEQLVQRHLDNGFRARGSRLHRNRGRKAGERRHQAIRMQILVYH